MSVEIRQGDCQTILAELEAESFSAAVTDPPYGLEFMGKEWDTFRGSNSGIKAPLFGKRKQGTPEFSPNKRNQKCPVCNKWAYDYPDRKCTCGGWKQPAQQLYNRRFQEFNESWAREVYRVLKPGAHLLAMGGTRTFHRLVCAIEDAGFEIRDTIMWLYGSGFPKSLDVSKALDRAAGAERRVVGVNPTYREMQAEASAYNLSRNPYITAPATEAARQWQGWGTALKPACELICVARKPSADVTSAELHSLTGWDHWCSSKSDGEDKIVTARALHSETRSYRARIDKEGREVSREDLGAYEPFTVDAIAANVFRHGTGAINIYASRVATSPRSTHSDGNIRSRSFANGGHQLGEIEYPAIARWPANICHDGSPEVLETFARFGEHASPKSYDRNVVGQPHPGHMSRANGDLDMRERVESFGDAGTAARFFFCAKADASERVGNHPTVKPVSLMEWLVRMVTPPGGRVLDCFCGTGSTLVACDRLGFDVLGIEQDAQTVADAHEKIRRMRARRMIGDAERVPVLPGQLGLDL